MRYLYDLGIWIYQVIIFLVRPFHQKAKLLHQGRKQTFALLTHQFQANKNPVAWFHVASLGEFEQGKPVIEKFKKTFPEYKILVTFFSPSGYEVRKNDSIADAICYLPADTRKNAKQFMELVRPDVIFFVKYDFWHHFIQQAHQRQIPMIAFSVILRPHQIYFKTYGRFFLNILARFTHIFVQNSATQKLLEEAKIENTTLSGDTRFDRVKQICDRKKEIEIATRFSQDQKVMVIGSSWQEDLEVIASVLDQVENLKLIIAPHEISAKNLNFTEKKFPSKTTIRYSQADKNTVQNYDILLVDNVGMLTSLYQYGTLAYVGGAFGKGLHNVLEPTVFGLPVFCGSNYSKFQEAKDLIALGSVFACSNTTDFEVQFLKIWNDETLQKNIRTICSQYITKNLGSSKKIISFYQKIKN